MAWLFGKGMPSRAVRALLAQVAELRGQLADAQAALDAERRVARVQQAEIDSLAAVIARDRERIHAETAAYARAIADAEGGRR
ncbi:MAG: hypothetical protein JSS27_07215 [Planctomycetes bacterium]|nr:hypothetical protein [Planctomycetota bacterium]